MGIGQFGELDYWSSWIIGELVVFWLFTHNQPYHGQ